MVLSVLSGHGHSGAAGPSAAFNRHQPGVSSALTASVGCGTVPIARFERTAPPLLRGERADGSTSPASAGFSFSRAPHFRYVAGEPQIVNLRQHYVRDVLACPERVQSFDPVTDEIDMVLDASQGCFPVLGCLAPVAVGCTAVGATGKHLTPVARTGLSQYLRCRAPIL